MQLMTFLQCAPDDVLVFSDMEQMLGDRRIYDSLDEVVEKAKKGNPDFDLYTAQMEYRAQGEYIFSMGDRGSDAWKLDKYKNIHTARKAWHLRPNKSWYFFIDADTYIFWPNFFQWLTRYNPEEKWYIGSRVDDGRPPFAHGGSGYLLSRAAIAELVGKDEKEVAERYDLEAVTGCCGDQELARTLQYKDINVTNVRPIIQGNEVSSLTFGPVEWCQPLITLHHMRTEVTNDVWQFELQRENPLVSRRFFSSTAYGSTSPGYSNQLTPYKSQDVLTIEDFYRGYIESQIVAYRDDWDNESADIVIEAPKEEVEQPKKSLRWKWDEPYKSFNLCGKACQENPECFMFRHHGETCSLGRSWKLGRKRLLENGVSWKSGWNLNRINKFKAENSPCKAPLWEAAP
jgi:Fringe-like